MTGTKKKRLAVVVGSGLTSALTSGPTPVLGRKPLPTLNGLTDQLLQHMSALDPNTQPFSPEHWHQAILALSKNSSTVSTQNYNFELPLVRSGNIAMMPSDKLPIKHFGEMEAYLAEGRSIGGLSGSPAFVRNTVQLPINSSKGRGHLSGLGSVHLLGLIHGHWDLPISFSESEQYEAVNMGVSIIVPAKKILETLYHPTLVALRDEHESKNTRTL
jgi:hypothetical protein